MPILHSGPCSTTQAFGTRSAGATASPTNGATRAYNNTSGDEPAFLVLSIEKSDGSASSEVRKNEGDLEISVLGLWTDEDSRLTGYRDKKEPEERQVDVGRMDLESAEWCILESWIKDGTLRRISQLILTIDLQWAGFEVGGVEEEVVRF
ncbi:hypothetical protein cypCar_00005823, partial [Cyprinus carpio]